jgi:hypothetical protein
MFPIELRETETGPRHFLGGRVLERGARVELHLCDQRWLVGTYEWSGQAFRWPSLRVELSLDLQGRRVTAAMPLPPEALLRWARP